MSFECARVWPHAQLKLFRNALLLRGQDLHSSTEPMVEPSQSIVTGRTTWPPNCYVNGRSRGTLNMKTLANSYACLAVVAAGILAGCSQTAKPPDVAGSIRTALDHAGFKNVSI